MQTAALQSVCSTLKEQFTQQYLSQVHSCTVHFLSVVITTTSSSLCTKRSSCEALTSFLSALLLKSCMSR